MRYLYSYKAVAVALGTSFDRLAKDFDPRSVSRNEARRLKTSFWKDRLKCCAICGNKGWPLEAAHIIPVEALGDSTDTNVLILCDDAKCRRRRSCHKLFDSGHISYQDIRGALERWKGGETSTHLRAVALKRLELTEDADKACERAQMRRIRPSSIRTLTDYMNAIKSYRVRASVRWLPEADQLANELETRLLDGDFADELTPANVSRRFYERGYLRLRQCRYAEARTEFQRSYDAAGGGLIGRAAATPLLIAIDLAMVPDYREWWRDRTSQRHFADECNRSEVRHVRRSAGNNLLNIVRLDLATGHPDAARESMQDYTKWLEGATVDDGLTLALTEVLQGVGGAVRLRTATTCEEITLAVQMLFNCVRLFIKARRRAVEGIRDALVYLAEGLEQLEYHRKTIEVVYRVAAANADSSSWSYPFKGHG